MLVVERPSAISIVFSLMRIEKAKFKSGTRKLC